MKTALSSTILGLGLMLAALAALAAQAGIYSYSTIPLTGSQGVPVIATSGYGWFSGIYNSDSKTLTFTFNWQLGNGATLGAVHFHGPASTTQNAGVAIGIDGAAATNAGKFGGSVVLTPAQESDLLGGLWYINLHSSTFPGGELRGQLIENSAGPGGPVFSPTSGTLTLPAAVVPQSGVFDATLQMVTGSSPLRFEVTKSVQVR